MSRLKEQGAEKLGISRVVQLDESKKKGKRNMKIQIWPKTKNRKWAVILNLLFVVLMV